MNFSRRLILPTVSLLGFIAAARIGPGAVGQQTATARKDVQASLVTVPPEVPADAVRYEVLLAGNRAGVLRLWITPDGARHNFIVVVEILQILPAESH